MKSALVVLFNQDFSVNIPKLERMYLGRFSHVVYLVPDYWSKLHRLYTRSRMPIGVVGALDNGVRVVRRMIGRRNPHELSPKERKAMGARFVRVLGHQFFFYDFVRQAAEALLGLDVDWFWVVGDDAILNPSLDEASLPGIVGVGPDADVAVCRPVIGSDAWLTRIAGSVSSARVRLEAAVGSLSAIRGKLQIDPEAGAIENQSVAVACADFFGLSRDAFRQVVPYWEACFRQRLYVEMALPNSLLAVARRPAVLDNFVWARIEQPEAGVKLLDRFRDEAPPLFVHPVKLSTVAEERLNGVART